MMDDIIDFSRRRRDMMELWKDTFHDSSRYIDIVFDTYATPEYTFTRYCENRIIASLLAVPYEFQILTEAGKRRRLRGVYLCGLATRTEWRRKGIMTGLMKEAESYFQTKGFDLAFLIPADDHLREYYRRKGYYDASFRREEEWSYDETSDSTRQKSMNIYTLKDFFNDGCKLNYLEQLADWCIDIETIRHWPTIVHSRKDMLAAMRENENSFFIADSLFDPEFPILAKVIAVGFPELSEDNDSSVLRIVELFTRENLQETDFASFRKAILKSFNRKTIRRFRAVVDDPYSKRGVEPYAMAKPLQSVEYLDKNPDPIFEISLMLD